MTVETILSQAQGLSDDSLRKLQKGVGEQSYEFAVMRALS